MGHVIASMCHIRHHTEVLRVTLQVHVARGDVSASDCYLLEALLMARASPSSP